MSFGLVALGFMHFFASKTNCTQSQYVSAGPLHAISLDLKCPLGLSLALTASYAKSPKTTVTLDCAAIVGRKTVRITTHRIALS
jgi:hypothetical protein